MASPGLCARGGRVVIVGVMPQGTTVPLDPFDLLFREIDLRTAFLNPHTRGRAAAMIAEGRLQLDPLISRVSSPWPKPRGPWRPRPGRARSR